PLRENKGVQPEKSSTPEDWISKPGVVPVLAKSAQGLGDHAVPRCPKGKESAELLVSVKHGPACAWPWELCVAVRACLIRKVAKRVDYAKFREDNGDCESDDDFVDGDGKKESLQRGVASSRTSQKTEELVEKVKALSQEKTVPIKLKRKLAGDDEEWIKEGEEKDVSNGENDESESEDSSVEGVDEEDEEWSDSDKKPTRKRKPGDTTRKGATSKTVQKRKSPSATVTGKNAKKSAAGPVPLKKAKTDPAPLRPDAQKRREVSSKSPASSVSTLSLSSPVPQPKTPAVSSIPRCLSTPRMIKRTWTPPGLVSKSGGNQPVASRTTPSIASSGRSLLRIGLSRRAIIGKPLHTSVKVPL
ncbi:unnamed protein product, partial [Cyprideis torosa]